jgi:hypothetical protein
MNAEGSKCEVSLSTIWAALHLIENRLEVNQKGHIADPAARPQWTVPPVCRARKNAKGTEIRDYFIRCEAVAKEGASKKLTREERIALALQDAVAALTEKDAALPLSSLFNGLNRGSNNKINTFRAPPKRVCKFLRGELFWRLPAFHFQKPSPLAGAVRAKQQHMAFARIDDLLADLPRRRHSADRGSGLRCCRSWPVLSINLV